MNPDINFSSVEERLFARAKESRTPIYGGFELTPYCNLACKMCYVRETAPGLPVMNGQAWLDIAQQAAEGLIWQTFVFGPALLDEKGKAFEDFSYSDVRAANPRAVIGYFEPGHYCLVQIDGRGTQSVLEPEKTNKGMTLEQTAQLMESLGCKAAYNLDGGQSASMYFGSDIISTPYHNGRAVGDAIVICDVQETAAHSEIYEVSEFEVTD